MTSRSLLLLLLSFLSSSAPGISLQSRTRGGEGHLRLRGGSKRYMFTELPAPCTGGQEGGGES
eukprot:763380-Hanusia_phi.AAC.5